jgi:glycosyltransferase EpsE
MSGNLKRPIVSVVMATFNEPASVISQSIISILEQTLNDLELLVIDDSTDPDTIKTINALARDPRVTVIRKTKRIGFVKALNIGLKQAKGKYIARMDGDDISEKDRLILQVTFLDSNPKYSVVGGAMNIMSETGSITYKRNYPVSSLKLSLWSVFRSPVSHPTVMMRREIVDRGFYYDESFSKAEDLEFWLRLMRNGFKFYNLTNTLINFRVGEDFVKKRSGSQLKNNYRARYKNFSWKTPIRSILSLCVAKLYMIVPEVIVKKVYSLENR